MEKYVNGRQAKPDEEKSDNEKYRKISDTKHLTCGKRPAEAGERRLTPAHPPRRKACGLEDERTQKGKLA